MNRNKILLWGFTAYVLCSLISMATMSIGAVLLLVAMVVHSGGVRGFGQRLCDEWRQSAIYRRFSVASLALLIACALSLVVAQVAPLGYGGQFVEVHFLKDMAKAWYLFWPLLVLPGLRMLTDEERALVLRRWILFFGSLSFLGVLQYFIGWPRPHMIPGHEPRYHAVLFFGHHLSLASVFIFPFFAALEINAKKSMLKRLRLDRRVVSTFLVAGFLALIATFSRTLWVALPVGILLWVLWVLPRKKAWITGSAILLMALAVAQHPSVKARIQTGLGLSERATLWLANLEFLKARPLTGAGWNQNLELSGYYLLSVGVPGNPVFQGHAHNNLIEALGGTGLLGAAAWIAWWFLVLKLSWRAARKRVDFARGALCALIVFHINGLTQVNFWESKVLHQLMWVVTWILLWSTSEQSKSAADLEAGV